MKNWYLLCLVFTVVSPELTAQKFDWKICREEAIIAEEAGDYFLAGLLFRQALDYRGGGNDLYHQAGNAFFNARAYQDAALAYQPIRKKEKKYPLIGLKYARALKQTGNYEGAREALQAFADSYKGPRADLALRIVKIDLEGCKMGMDTFLNPDFAYFELHPRLQAYNGPTDDFNPTVLPDSRLYWITEAEHKGQIITHKGNPSLDSNRIPAPFLLETENNYIGSFCPSSDGQRVYFSRCTKYLDELGLAKESCTLFVTYSLDTTWSMPIELDERINAKGASSNYPFVVTGKDQEWLYFSSDRRGTAGGLDIWYASRPLNPGIFEFSVPQNCGRTINSRGDEVTPWIRSGDSTLFFSSNAHAGFGGFDIFFSTKKENNTWEEPVNLGFPINSSANELYFSEPQKDFVFLVANRTQEVPPSPKRDYDMLLYKNNPPAFRTKVIEESKQQKEEGMHEEERKE